MNPFPNGIGPAEGLIGALFMLFVLGVAIMVIAVCAGVLIRLVGRLFACVGGVVGDVVTAAVNLVVAPFSLARALVLLVFGRFREADRSAERFQQRVVEVAMRAWSAVVQRPLRVFGVRVPPDRRVLVPAAAMAPAAMARAAAPAAPPFGRMAPPPPIGGRTAVMPPPWPEPASLSTEFPGYVVEGRLPSGGSGAKLFIAAPDPAKQAALRGAPAHVVIKSFAIGEGSTLPQIIRESRSLDAARSLGCVLDHALEPHRFWYAMPHFVGPTLTALVNERHRGLRPDEGLPVRTQRELVSLMADVVDNLARFHRAGLWHKDVKPDNIIVSGGRAQLIDVGLVTPLASTFTLTTHGTEYFRDPEMVRQALRGTKVHQVDGARFDIYSAGAVLYSVLENTFPAHGALSRFEKPSPESLRWIVRRAMADYHRRYATMEELLADLRFVLTASSADAVKPAQLPSMRGGGAAAMQASDADGPSAAAAGRAEHAAHPGARSGSRWPRALSLACRTPRRSAGGRAEPWSPTTWSPWATAAIAVAAIIAGVFKSNRDGNPSPRARHTVVESAEDGRGATTSLRIGHGGAASREDAAAADLPAGNGRLLVERTGILSLPLPETAESAAMAAIGSKGWTPVTDDAEALAALATLVGREPEVIQAELSRRGYRGLVRLEPRGERVHVSPVSFIAR